MRVLVKRIKILFEPQYFLYPLSRTRYSLTIRWNGPHLLCAPRGKLRDLIAKLYDVSG